MLLRDNGRNRNSGRCSIVFENENTRCLKNNLKPLISSVLFHGLLANEKKPAGGIVILCACEFRLDPETCNKFVDIRLAEAGERYRPRYEVTKDHR